MLHEDDVLSLRKMTQTFSAINLASKQKATNLFFSSQVRKRFKGHSTVAGEVISL